MSWTCTICDCDHPGRFSFCPVSGEPRQDDPDSITDARIAMVRSCLVASKKAAAAAEESMHHMHVLIARNHQLKVEVTQARKERDVARGVLRHTVRAAQRMGAYAVRLRALVHGQGPDQMHVRAFTEEVDVSMDLLPDSMEAYDHIRIDGEDDLRGEEWLALFDVVRGGR